MVKSALKVGKAAAPDDIPPEVYKYCDFYDICLNFCNRALLENEKPELWFYMNVIASGDLSNTNNYRGISLICIIAKIYNILIFNRISTASNL